MVYIFDDFLDDFDSYYKDVRSAKFADVISQGKSYKDISQEISPDILYNNLIDKLPFGTENVLSFLRAYKKVPDYKPHSWIHSDVLFSNWIAIFMVQSSEFPQDDAVALWDHLDLGGPGYCLKDLTDPNAATMDKHTLDPGKWKIRERIEFRKNRLVMFPAHYFHSKANLGNHGDIISNCRIVHVMFFNEKGVSGV